MRYIFLLVWGPIQILCANLTNLNNLPQLTSTGHRTKKYLIKMRIQLSLGLWLIIDMFFIIIN